MHIVTASKRMRRSHRGLGRGTLLNVFLASCFALLAWWFVSVFEWPPDWPPRLVMSTRQPGRLSASQTNLLGALALGLTAQCIYILLWRTVSQVPNRGYRPWTKEPILFWVTVVASGMFFALTEFEPPFRGTMSVELEGIRVVDVQGADSFRACWVEIDGGYRTSIGTLGERETRFVSWAGFYRPDGGPLSSSDASARAQMRKSLVCQDDLNRERTMRPR